MRSEQELKTAIERYADTVLRLSTLYMKNNTDTEDIFQTVFMKYMLNSTEFDSPEHEKYWIIRVTINACKDVLRNFFRKFTISIDEIQEIPHDDKSLHNEVMDAVLALPQKYREVVYLHYYEGYTAPEISKILGKNTNTIYTLLNRSRQLLKEELGGEYHE